jgi:protein-L-isoaspartate(D-aspartate) O-methyltransferase
LLPQVPREDFVPPAQRNLAFADIELPLGHGQAMMPPRLEARLLQALDIRPTDTILEIGTGSAYLTALLARSGSQVHSVDIFADFIASAREKLAGHGITNVVLETGDAARGWAAHAPYDVIAVTGSLPLFSDLLRQQLQVGGRLFMVVGQAPSMEALLVTRVGPEAWTRESLFETDLPSLINAPTSPVFVF